MNIRSLLDFLLSSTNTTVSSHSLSSSFRMDELSSLLAALSPEEQAILRPVLERDLEFQRRETERITSIKAGLEVVERKSSGVKEGQNSLGLTVPSHRGSPSSGISSGDSFGSQLSLGSSALSPLSPLTPRNCNDCGCKLGLIFNSGLRCIRCESLLCELCRIFPDNERSGSAYCKKCFGHRKVLAASGEWMGVEEDKSISATLLTKMRRESEHRARSPEQFRTRNMSLPPMSHSNLLCLPSEETRPHTEVGKFWKGSPSPRSPFAPHQLGVSHTRDTIGSPSPRPLTPNSHAHHFIPQETAEEGVESLAIDQSRDRRLSWSSQKKKKGISRQQSHNWSDRHEEDLRMEGNEVEKGGTPTSVRSSILSRGGRRDSSLSTSQHDSISIGSMSSTDGSTNTRPSSSLSLYGHITLHLQYHLQSASLSISILSCTKLPNLEGGLKPNPYVKLLLIRKAASDVIIKHKTRSKRATNEPQFNYEIHLPNLTKSELEQYVLCLSVCHRDRIQKSTVIGEVHLPLNNYPWHIEKCTIPLEGQSMTPPDPAPSPSSLRSIRLTTTFHIVDRERKIGTLLVHLQSITFHSSDTTLGSIVVCGKLFMGGRRVAKEESARMRVPNPNPGKETSAHHCLSFHNINLNDLHLQMFVLSVWEQKGLMSSRPLGQVILNHIDHRRNVSYPSHCTCSLCSHWLRLLDNPSLNISCSLPLSSLTLDDTAIAIL